MLENLFHFGPLVLQKVVPFLVVLGIVVFVHEFGHFWVARRCGVRVTDFSIGFGPELWGWHDRLGTRWKLCGIPLGGYVKFHGDLNAASAPPPASVGHADSSSEREDPFLREAFHAQPVLSRALIVAAGPVANYVFAFFVFFLIAFFYGVPVDDGRITGVRDGYPAQKAGLKAGDRLISVAGISVHSFHDVQRAILSHGEGPLEVIVERGTEKISKVITPILDSKTSLPLLGIERSFSGPQQLERPLLFDAVTSSFQDIFFLTQHSLSAIGKMVVGRGGMENLSGPIGIAEMTSQAVHYGFIPFLKMIGILSVSIGLINLFPIPLLDGGHLAFYLIEAVRGRPLSERIQALGFQIGFAVVIALMVFSTWNDLYRFFLSKFGF